MTALQLKKRLLVRCSIFFESRDSFEWRNDQQNGKVDDHTHTWGETEGTQDKEPHSVPTFFGASYYVGSNYIVKQLFSFLSSSSFHRRDQSERAPRADLWNEYVPSQPRRTSTYIHGYEQLAQMYDVLYYIIEILLVEVSYTNSQLHSTALHYRK